MTGYPPAMTLRPLTGWPMQFTVDRKPSRFESSFPDTIKLLDRELRLLDPNDGYYPPSILQLAIDESKFRRDGMPRAGATPTHPGVILNIEPRNRPALSFPCDTFTHWHANLRAIALTLEALRKIDRYGVTQTGQQYRGWQALPAAGDTTVAITVDAAADFLRTVAGEEGRGLDLNTVAQTYRRARANSHPDRHGGDQTQWDRVEAAAQILRSAGVLS
ncbi:molecular chaperone DnaJ [Mycobacterium sp. 852013-50091_SCH5140682]|uniref:hypothetical protein n=1 Tax=Mycobacterium sp. 852013-50091_SCH5140682 TaxID=1834109 RepID=UPI0007EB4A44|nr:hypothetical protein [Mycobacterium sp. 852013-50091_SCH5140682]OBC11398.1 molecular chaperone DnaJ [Mycobacterium sp. 852013-50091_SCH5140682]